MIANGSGAVVLTAASTRTGDSSVAAGVLRLTNASALGTGAINVTPNFGFTSALELAGVNVVAPMTLGSSGTLRGTGDAIYGGKISVSSGASVTLATGTAATDKLTIGHAANDLTGGSALAKITVKGVSGSQVILNQPSNYTGGWTAGRERCWA